MNRASGSSLRLKGDGEGLRSQRVASVLQVVLSLNPGGTERLVLELVNRLAGQSRQAVCCLDEAGAWGEALEADGTPVISLGRQPGFHPLLAKGVWRRPRET